MNKSLLAVLVALLLMPLAAYAQNGTITGVVVDEDQNPMPGASVTLPAIDRGTSTDMDGAFTFTAVPEGAYDVQATFVGYRTARQRVEVAAGQTVRLSLTLQEDILGLEDVVVIGYSQIPKREVTGSITSIRARDIEQLNIQTVDQAIQGRAAGVVAQNLSGQPGGGVHIRIRGQGSINAGNSPLYVVDGVPMSTTDLFSTNAEAADRQSNPLGGINPQDIQSIEILKDAAAASIYGAQASNGVVLITTKRGSAGVTRYNATMSLGSSEQANRVQLIDAPDWARLQVEAFENSYAFNPALAPAGVTSGRQWAAQVRRMGQWVNEDGSIDYDSMPTTDWQDALLRSGFNRKINLSASGGTQATRFYLSGGYDYEEGTAIASDFERLNLRANLDHQASDLLALELNINLASMKQNGVLEGGYFYGSPFFAGFTYSPLDPIYLSDGSYNPTPAGYNAVGVLNLDERSGRTNHLVVNGAARFNIVEGLTFRSFYGLDYRNVRERDYRSPESDAGRSLNGYLYQADRQVANFTTNQIFNYRGEVGGNMLTGLFGFEYRHQDRTTVTASGTGFPSGLFRTLQNAADPYGVNGFGTGFKSASVLGQAKYDLMDRYLLNVTARYDGSSRFGEDRRWGLFYSGSLAWVLSSEPFMAWSEDYIDDLKLRLSYGSTGNTDGIGDFDARQLFGSGGAYAGQPALRPTGLGNNVLTWESAQTINLGLDWTILGGRVYGAVDAYRRDTKDLLLERTLPIDSGFSNLLENVGSIRNTGLEIELGAILVDQGGFQWTSDFNIGFHNNEILELAGGVDYLNVDGWGLLFKGESLGAYFLYEFAGVNPADGRPMFYDREGEITYTPQASIESGDRRIVGDPTPDYFGGWNNRLSYGGFTLDALLQFNVGQMTNDLQSSFYEGNFTRGFGMTESAYDRWQQPGDMTHIERAQAFSAYPGRVSGLTTGSTRYMQDASYVRLKNVRLSYALPASLTNNIGLSGASIFVQGTNLVTWTDYPGADPEMVGSNTVVYPQPRTYTTGLQIGF